MKKSSRNRCKRSLSGDEGRSRKIPHSCGGNGTHEISSTHDRTVDGNEIFDTSAEQLLDPTCTSQYTPAALYDPTSILTEPRAHQNLCERAFFFSLPEGASVKPVEQMQMEKFLIFRQDTSGKWNDTHQLETSGSSDAVKKHDSPISTFSVANQSTAEGEENFELQVNKEPQATQSMQDALQKHSEIHHNIAISDDELVSKVINCLLHPSIVSQVSQLLLESV